MKKLFIILGGIVVVILLAAIILPLIFKDDIKQKVSEEINNSVNAEVYFEDFGLSLLRNFPNATASLYDFGVVNKAPFEGDTLLSVKSFRIVVNIWSALFSDQIKINNVELNDPQLLVIVLEDGTANYDIMLEDEADTVETEEETEFNVSVKKWELNNGNIAYYDMANKVLTTLKGVNHEGSGDFTQDIFDLRTQTSIDQFTLNYDDAEYMTNKRIEADVTLEMNMPEFRFTFKENNVRINDFSFGFDGWLAMPEEAIDMDITFAAKENTFKSLYSLVPGAYKEGFEDVQADGTLQFNGAVTGTYSDSTEQMPAFNLNLVVEDGVVQYPDLPSSISAINMNLLVENPDGIIENTLINLRQFHLELGNNPVDAKAVIDGLETMKIDASLDAKVNLEELNQMLPMEGLSLRGLFSASVKANGTYDSATSQFPTVDATMNLNNGYVKTAEFPSVIDNMKFDARIANQNGEMSETEIWVNDFNMALDNEPFAANLYLKDLANYTWDLSAKGTLDLEKIARIMELEDMTLRGKIAADINTKGDMAAVEAERYDQLPTSGDATVENFYFESVDLPQGFTINNATATFNPDRINLTRFTGAVGVSDLNLTGHVSNYMGYLFRENETIRGEMTLRSKQFNANEWMTDEETTETDDTLELEVIEIPKNIDFAFNSTIDHVLYDNLSLNDVTGKITISGGRLSLDNLKFNLLEGQFTMTGYYSTEDIDNPVFQFDMDIDNLSVQEAYTSFNSIQKLAPIAQHLNGRFSTNLTLGGGLQPDMMPDYPTLVGKGLVELAGAAIKDSKIISGVTSLASQNKTDEVNLEDIKASVEIREGRVHVKPFDFKLGNIAATAYGSNGIDGSLDYIVGMDIPSGQIGQAVNQAIASITGQKNLVGEKITVNVKVGGTYADPSIGIASTEAAEGEKSAVAKARESVKDQVAEQKEEIKEEVKQRVEEKKEEVKKEVEEKKEEVKENVKQELKKEAEKAREKLKKLF